MDTMNFLAQFLMMTRIYSKSNQFSHLHPDIITIISPSVTQQPYYWSPIPLLPILPNSTYTDYLPSNSSRASQRNLGEKNPESSRGLQSSTLFCSWLPLSLHFLLLPILPPGPFCSSFPKPTMLCLRVFAFAILSDLRIPFSDTPITHLLT